MLSLFFFDQVISKTHANQWQQQINANIDDNLTISQT